LIWDDFCSWYLEWIKPEYGHAISKNVYEKTVAYFDQLLQLLHPYMPFITEEIYHLLKERDEDLTVKQMGETGMVNQNIIEAGIKLKTLISSIRDARNKNQLKPKESISLFIQTTDAESYSAISNILKKQINAEAITFNETPEETTVTLVVDNEKV